MFFRKAYGKRPGHSRILIYSLLASGFRRHILSARAPAMVNTYDRVFRRWKEFALSKHELSYLPANPIHIAIYLQYVLESTRSDSLADTVFFSIKWAHKSAGLVSPTDNPLVNRVRKAAKRILGAKRCHRKEPLSIEITSCSVHRLFPLFIH